VRNVAICEAEIMLKYTV